MFKGNVEIRIRIRGEQYKFYLWIERIWSEIKQKKVVLEASEGVEEVDLLSP